MASVSLQSVFPVVVQQKTRNIPRLLEYVEEFGNLTKELKKKKIPAKRFQQILNELSYYFVFQQIPPDFSSKSATNAISNKNLLINSLFLSLQSFLFSFRNKINFIHKNKVFQFEQDKTMMYLPFFFQDIPLLAEQIHKIITQAEQLFQKLPMDLRPYFLSSLGAITQQLKPSQIQFSDAPTLSSATQNFDQHPKNKEIRESFLKMLDNIILSYKGGSNSNPFSQKKASSGLKLSAFGLFSTSIAKSKEKAQQNYFVRLALSTFIKQMDFFSHPACGINIFDNFVENCQFLANNSQNTQAPAPTASPAVPQKSSRLSISSFFSNSQSAASNTTQVTQPINIVQDIIDCTQSNESTIAKEALYVVLELMKFLSSQKNYKALYYLIISLKLSVFSKFQVAKISEKQRILLQKSENDQESETNNSEGTNLDEMASANVAAAATGAGLGHSKKIDQIIPLKMPILPPTPTPTQTPSPQKQANSNLVPILNPKLFFATINLSEPKEKIAFFYMSKICGEIIRFGESFFSNNGANTKKRDYPELVLKILEAKETLKYLLLFEEPMVFCEALEQICLCDYGFGMLLENVLDINGQRTPILVLEVINKVIAMGLNAKHPIFGNRSQVPVHGMLNSAFFLLQAYRFYELKNCVVDEAVENKMKSLLQQIEDLMLNYEDSNVLLSVYKCLLWAGKDLQFLHDSVIWGPNGLVKSITTKKQIHNSQIINESQQIDNEIELQMKQFQQNSTKKSSKKGDSKKIDYNILNSSNSNSNGAPPVFEWNSFQLESILNTFLDHAIVEFSLSNRTSLKIFEEFFEFFENFLANSASFFHTDGLTSILLRIINCIVQFGREDGDKISTIFLKSLIKVVDNSMILNDVESEQNFLDVLVQFLGEYAIILSGGTTFPSFQTMVEIAKLENLMKEYPLTKNSEKLHIFEPIELKNGRMKAILKRLMDFASTKKTQILSSIAIDALTKIAFRTYDPTRLYVFLFLKNLFFEIREFNDNDDFLFSNLRDIVSIIEEIYEFSKGFLSIIKSKQANQANSAIPFEIAKKFFFTHEELKTRISCFVEIPPNFLIFGPPSEKIYLETKAIVGK